MQDSRGIFVGDSPAVVLAAVEVLRDLFLRSFHHSGGGGEGETEEDSINGDLIGIRLNGSSWDGLTRLLLVTCLVG